MRLTIGYPDEEAERRILLESARTDELLERIDPVLSPRQVVTLQERVEGVHAEPDLVDYLMEVVRTTRSEPRFSLGVSPRGAIALFRAARAHALLSGRDYLVPDDVRELVVPCLAHRLLPVGVGAATAEAHEESAGILEDLLEQVPVPV
jgi:MoxR-like ATPase